jgi:ATP-dependent DNA helicase RecG
MLKEKGILSLLSLTHETEWLEIKHNIAIPEQIGQYISALSNSAAIARL